MSTPSTERSADRCDSNIPCVIPENRCGVQSRVHLPLTVCWVGRCIDVVRQLEVEVVVHEVAPEVGRQQDSRVGAWVAAKIIDAPLLEYEIREC